MHLLRSCDLFQNCQFLTQRRNMVLMEDACELSHIWAQTIGRPRPFQNFIVAKLPFILLHSMIRIIVFDATI
jgi:hypothetical protein